MRDYVLLAVVIGLVPFILYRAWIGALAWTWIGLMNPHLYTWELRNFPFAQVIGIAFLIAWFFGRKKMIPTTAGVIGLCVLLAYVTLKNPFAWNQDEAWALWNQYAKIVVAALLIGTLIYTPYRVRWFLWTVLFSIGVFYGVKGGVFALATGGNFNVQGPVPSFIGGNTHLGVALIMVAPLFLAFMRDAQSVWLKRGALASFWLSLAAILFTYSRGAWLGLAAIAALLFLQTKRKLLVAAVLVPFAMGIMAYIPERLFSRMDTIAEYQEDLSAQQRLQGWGVALNVAIKHPLGAGFGLDATPVDVWMQYANFHRPEFKRANAAHSIYFQMLGDHGFLGLALFLFVLLATFLTLQRVKSLVTADPDRAWLGHYASAIQVGLVGYCVSGAFVSLAWFDLFYTYVVLAGILLREAAAPADSTETAAAAKLAPFPSMPVRGSAGLVK